MNYEEAVEETPEKSYYLHITVKTIGIVRNDDNLSREEFLIMQGLPDKIEKYSGRKRTILTMRLVEKELSPEALNFLMRMRERLIIENWSIEETSAVY